MKNDIRSRKRDTEEKGGERWISLLVFLFVLPIFSGMVACGQRQEASPHFQKPTDNEKQDISRKTLREMTEVKLPSSAEKLRIYRKNKGPSLVTNGVFAVRDSLQEVVSFYKQSLDTDPLFFEGDRAQFALDDNPRNPVYIFLERYKSRETLQLGGGDVGEAVSSDVQSDTVLLRVYSRKRKLP